MIILIYTDYLISILIDNKVDIIMKYYPNQTAQFTAFLRNGEVSATSYYIPSG